MPQDPHQPLRDDVRLLGDLLGQTLRAQEGVELFERVEAVRALAKNARTNDRDFETLASELSSMPVHAAIPVARAFAHFLNLANIAEQHHRIRRRRAYLRDPHAAPQRGSCEEVFARLITGGVSPDRLFEAVVALRIELVLTAHPTEVARRTLVHKYNRIARTLDRRDRVDLTIPEHQEAETALLREITAAWGTSEVRDRPPSPLDEVRAGLTLFQESLWEAMPRYVRALDRALHATAGRRLPPGVIPVRFGSWIGGDRDGNPNVTAEVTRRASLMARWVAADLYVDDLQYLREELSVSRATPELRDAVDAAPEPYRELMRRLRDRMASTRTWIERCLRGESSVPPPDAAIVDPAEFDAALRMADNSLRRCGYGVLADGRLADTRNRLAAFGLVLAPLDIRQEASRHTDAVAALAQANGLGDFTRLDEPGRIRLLITQLQRAVEQVRPTEPTPDVREVLDTCALIGDLPGGSLGAYVITMASRASDVLAVEWLQRCAGVRNPLRVVPLFETGRDLEHAGAVLRELLAIPWYRERIKGRQEVMIGYSDSAKDIGRLAAGWALYQAQEQIVDVCRAARVSLTLFHGRGGSVGRGGGPTYLALQSQPPGSLDGSIRVTEQGEMLQALFGLVDIAVRTLDVYTTGVLESWLVPSAPPRPEWRACMDRLAADARSAYRRIVHEDATFVDYFRAATPEPEIGSMNIGSRPARRSSGGGVTSLRAIPWQFAWTQTRLILGAWLGVETALEEARARGEQGVLCQMYHDWAFFRSAIDLIEMVIAKTDDRIAAEYDRRLVPPELRPLGVDLRDRLARATRGVLQISGHRQPLESNRVLRRSIDVRNPYVDPINLVQIELLRRLREAEDPQLRNALMVTINGIAAGMRNTG
jgi:phosphoenolpyruvate carboxylase